ncbi:MAG: hypothetical protein IPN53_11795 [Comamonadaceae bacterium]|nr:hypothetical protein [Comamonadaceae bacterium]
MADKDIIAKEMLKRIGPTTALMLARRTTFSSSIEPTLCIFAFQAQPLQGENP